MLPDKEIKKKFRIEASKNPEKYFAVDVLKSEGFQRKKYSSRRYMLYRRLE